MSVTIQLDKPQEYYTNLDYISGNVILSCSSEETITAVVVKLEGESVSQLLRPPQQYPAAGRHRRERRRDQDEIVRENHKILYKVQQAFPKSQTANGLDNAVLAVGINYTLPPGQHVWPFRFRLPVNNVCANLDMQGVGASYGFGGVMPGQMAYKHVTKPLPPTVTEFPNEAIISSAVRYFVKVTVQRPGIWRENRRFQLPFRFLPVEQLRPTVTGQETFARRSHDFVKAPAPHTIKRKPSLFTKENPPSPLSNAPPSVTVDARLPNPAILICRKPIPLRLLVKKQTDSPEHVFLTNLQIDLISSTHIRAQDIQRNQPSTWIIISKANLRIPISKPDDEVGEEMVVDGSGLWDVLPIPSGVLPSFQTCNMSRSYQLEIRVGLGYGVEGPSGTVQPQSIVQLPLLIPVQIFSGIPQPQELQNGGIMSNSSNSPITGLRPPMPPRPGTGIVHSGSPAPIPRPQAYDPAYPPQLRPDALNDDDAPPPSYEDAISSGISPIQTGTPSGLDGSSSGGLSNGTGTPTAQSRMDSKS